jgi:hypothetical protein
MAIGVKIILSNKFYNNNIQYTETLLNIFLETVFGSSIIMSQACTKIDCFWRNTNCSFSMPKIYKFESRHHCWYKLSVCRNATLW